MNTKTTIVLLLLLAATSTLLHAQSSDTILPNPNAVLLRKIWMIRGETTGPNAGGMVGDGAGTLGDLNGDSLTDFAVRSAKNGQWHIYFGADPAPDTTSQWSCKSPGGLDQPVIGDFWGNQQTHIGFLQYRKGDTNNSSQVFFQLYLFADSGATLATQPTIILDPEATMEKGLLFVPHDIEAHNLDHQTGDELVVTTPVTLRNKQRSTNAELWFFKGGPDFQVNQPTKIIVDPDENDDRAYSTAFADFDGDHFLDMAIGCGYPSGPKLKIWYGRDGSPWNWNSTPDRVIHLSNNIGLNTPLTFADYDGDSLLDFAGQVWVGPQAGVYLYLSRSDKGFRNRSFSLDDADKTFLSTTYFLRGPLGPMNDPTHTFDMFSVIGQNPALLAFSGSRNGPDLTNEAWYSEGVVANIFYQLHPLTDCNGDGWSDVLVNDPKWWGSIKALPSSLLVVPTFHTMTLPWMFSNSQQKESSTLFHSGRTLCVTNSTSLGMEG